jgi:hypothetical protein
MTCVKSAALRRGARCCVALVTARIAARRALSPQMTRQVSVPGESGCKNAAPQTESHA